MEKGVLRIGLAKRLKLEVPASLRDKLPGPLRATVGYDDKGLLAVTFNTDLSSPYDWGQLSQQWNIYSLEIPREKINFTSPEAAQAHFTFTKPVGRFWTPGQAVFPLPAQMRAPRTVSRVNKRQAAVPEIRAYINQTQPEVLAGPVWNPNQPSLGEVAEELPTGVSRWWRPGLQGHDVSALVAELNLRLAADPGLSVRLSDRVVQVWEYIE